jgi:hypothetical protein
MFKALLILLLSPGLLLQQAMFFSSNVPQTPSFGTVSYETRCSNTAGSTCTTPSVTAGSTIYINAISFATTTATLTDNGTTITPITGYPKSWYTAGATDYVWVVKNASSGTHAYVVTWGASSYPAMGAVVLSGASSTTPTDAISTYTNNALTGTMTCNTVTTTEANEFLLSFGNIGGGLGMNAVGTAPQLMIAAFGNSTGDFSEYGTAVTAGSNFVEYGTNASSSGAVCDTIAVH